MAYVRGLIALIYVYGVLFFGIDQYKIVYFMKELDDSGLSLNVEQNVYAFLGVKVNADKKSGKVTLNQEGLTKKVLHIVGVLNSYEKTTPAANMPLVTDADGNPFDETWYYDFDVVMLMYLFR